jgi:hypothetical protein
VPVLSPLCCLQFVFIIVLCFNFENVLAYFSFGVRKSRHWMYHISSACHQADLDCSTLVSITLAEEISLEMYDELKICEWKW